MALATYQPGYAPSPVPTVAPTVTTETTLTVSVQRDALVSALTLGIKALGKRSYLPVLDNALLTASDNSTVSVATTDLDTSIRTDIGATVTRAGAVTLPARDLLAFAKGAAKGSWIEIDVTTTRTSYDATMPHADRIAVSATLTAGALRSTLKGIDAGEYPVIPAGAEYHATMTAPALRSGILAVVGCAASDEARPILTGVSWTLSTTGAELAAADNYRIGIVTVPTACAVGCACIAGATLIPSARGLRLVADAIGAKGTGLVVVGANDKRSQMSFVVGASTLIVRTMDGTFPNYPAIIPANTADDPYMVLRVGTLLASVKGAGEIAKHAANVVMLEWSEIDAEVYVTATADAGTYNVTLPRDPAQHVSGSQRAAFNARYMVEILGAMDPAAVVRFTMRDPLAPATLRAGDALYVVMPVRTNR